MTDLHPAELVQAVLPWSPQAMTIPAIAYATGLTVREVQAGCEELRRRGVAIISGPRGMAITQDPDELLDSYRRLRSRALHQLANLRQMQRTARAMRGLEQQTLWEVA